MSGGIFAVGFVVGIALFLFGLGLNSTNCIWKKLGFTTIFIAICFFGSMFVLSLAFPNGFEEIRHAIRGYETISFKMQLVKNNELSKADEDLIAELKRDEASIIRIDDHMLFDSSYNVKAYYRCMTMLRPKQAKKDVSISSQYKSMISE